MFVMIIIGFLLNRCFFEKSNVVLIFYTTDGVSTSFDFHFKPGSISQNSTGTTCVTARPRTSCAVFVFPPAPHCALGASQKQIGAPQRIWNKSIYEGISTEQIGPDRNFLFQNKTPSNSRDTHTHPTVFLIISFLWFYHKSRITEIISRISHPMTSSTVS